MRIGRLSERKFSKLLRHGFVEIFRGSLFYGFLSVSVISAVFCGMLVVPFLEEPKAQYFYIVAKTGSSLEYRHPLKLIVADNFYLRFKGLSNRPSLPTEDGMIFIFHKTQQARFVMRDMKFNLDFAFLDEAGTIIKLERNVSKGFEGKIESGNQVSAVVEIPSGNPAAQFLTEQAILKRIDRVLK